jgi:hypothetical protein
VLSVVELFVRLWVLATTRSNTSVWRGIITRFFGTVPATGTECYRSLLRPGTFCHEDFRPFELFELNLNTSPSIALRCIEPRFVSFATASLQAAAQTLYSLLRLSFAEVGVSQKKSGSLNLYRPPALKATFCAQEDGVKYRRTRTVQGSFGHPSLEPP